MMEEIKHSIIMICYNQQDYIKKALDSVLLQKVQPFEIIIGDDYSSDNTRDILLEYKEKYPSIIKLYLHDKNHGIFQNLNKICCHANGDLIHFLSGDDWYSPNFLENMNLMIKNLKLNPRDEAFIIYPKTIMHHLNGEEFTINNSQKELNNYSPIGLALRGLSKWRLVGISYALYLKWPRFEIDSNKIGPWADRIHYVLFAQHIKSQYLMEQKGPVYRVGVGISSKSPEFQLNQSYFLALKRIKQYQNSGELSLSRNDIFFLDFIYYCYLARTNPNLKNLLKYCIMATKVFLNSPLDIKLVIKEVLTDIKKLKRSIKNL